MPQQAPNKKMTLTYFCVVAHMLTGGRAYWGSAQSPAGFLKLTTTERKSGQPRTVELIYLRDGSDYVVTASNAGRPRYPGWYFNLRSNPRVTIEAHGTHRQAVAEVAGPAKRAELWARLIEIAPSTRATSGATRARLPWCSCTLWINRGFILGLSQTTSIVYTCF